MSDLHDCTSFCRNSDNSNALCRACADKSWSIHGSVANIIKRLKAQGGKQGGLISELEGILEDFAAPNTLVITREELEKLKRQDLCFAMQDEVLSAQVNGEICGRNALIDELIERIEG